MSIAQDIGQVGAAAGIAGPRAHHREGRLQPLAGAAGRALHPSLHRHGLWLQRVLAAAVQAIGITKPVACAADVGLIGSLFTTTCDWKVADLGWMYTLFFVLLGSSAAIWGGWLERVGPPQGRLRLGDVLVRRPADLGDRRLHPSALAAVVGSGVIGGIGLGLGYISPVSTLVKWFPDRRGMATGMAIMGFGGGAMIGSPLANLLMNYFKTPTGRRLADLRGDGRDLFRLHDGGRLRLSHPPPNWRPKAGPRRRRRTP
jgi:MFS family permease